MRSTITLPRHIIILVLFISGMAVMHSCQKSPGTQNTVASQLDSIVSGNSSIHFMYDAQGRVIEDRYQVADTLQERNVYEYNGSDTMPAKKKHYHRWDANPDATSVFLYNSNKQKTYDSTYFPGSTDHTVIKLNYYASNRIAVLKDQNFANYTSHNWVADTVYLGSNQQIDSLRVYTGASQSIYGTWNYWYTSKFSQYDNQQNLFATLSSSRSDFYPIDLNNFGSFTTNNFYPVLDYYNQTNACTIATDIKYINYFGPYSLFQKQFQFNADNLPVTEKITYTYTYMGNNFSTITDYRFVYK
ncbi:hypothetical protein [Ferruginibacter sp.]